MLEGIRVKISPRGLIVTDPVTLQTTEEGKLKAILPYALPREIRIRAKNNKILGKLVK